MPKKSKKSKASAKSKPVEKGGEDAKGTANYMELVAQDPNFYVGKSRFEFPNGDKYEGAFCAHVNGLIWRQGHGTYITKDGQSYEGEWDGDKLLENSDVTITYGDGVKYVGPLVKSKYSGSGVYQLEEKVSLICKFADNKPSGEVVLLDPNGKTWHGFAEKEDSLLIQEHPFYRSIGKDLGKGRSKRKPEKYDSKTSVQSSKNSLASKDGPKYCDLRQEEKELFAKSIMTPAGDMLSSEWYQDYNNYCDTYGNIIRKVKATGEGSLSNEEYLWYKKYRDFEKKYLSALKDFKTKKTGGMTAANNTMFQFIHSEEYKLMTKPTPVFYPKEPLLGEDCDSTCECIDG